MVYELKFFGRWTALQQMTEEEKRGGAQRPLEDPDFGMSLLVR